MKRSYTKAQLEFELISSEDIMTSSPSNIDNGGANTETGWGAIIRPRSEWI